MLIILNVWKTFIFHLKVTRNVEEKTSYKYVKGKVQPKKENPSCHYMVAVIFSVTNRDFYSVINPKRNDYDSSSGEPERLNHVSSHYNKVNEIF